MNIVGVNKMKQGLESIIKKGKVMAFAGAMSLMPLTLSAQSSDSGPEYYVEPRAGLMIPDAPKKQEYKSSFKVGVSGGIDLNKIGIEAGLGYYNSSRKYIETKSLLPKINVKIYPEKGEDIKPYIMAGANMLKEYSTINIPESDVQDKVSNTTMGAEIGFGATISNKFDWRMSYTRLPKSENVKGMLSLSIGYQLGK